MPDDESPLPEDFIKGYSPLKPAELLIMPANRPSSRVRELLRKIRGWLPVAQTTNDNDIPEVVP